jgi:hypothetical protein
MLFRVTLLPAGGPLSFALPVSGIRSSLVQLEAQADSMRFVVNTSPGKILGERLAVTNLSLFEGCTAVTGTRVGGSMRCVVNTSPGKILGERHGSKFACWFDG